MPPYFCPSMGGRLEIEPLHTMEPIRGNVPFAVLSQPEVVLDLESYNPCDEDESTPISSTGSVSGSTSSSSCHKKHVSFTALHIREHSVILGDHPCCTAGFPVTLDWTVEKEQCWDLEEYEATRERRRSRSEMILSREDRCAMLQDVIPQCDVRRVQRQLHRERRCTGRAKMAFFSKEDLEPRSQGQSVLASDSSMSSSE